MGKYLRYTVMDWPSADNLSKTQGLIYRVRKYNDTESNDLKHDVLLNLK